jgi:hypothetical protein
MEYPVLPDKTTLVHYSIGLSFLLAELTGPWFGGVFITFSEEPEVVKVGRPLDNGCFTEKVSYAMGAHQGMWINFVAVFEKLILPMVIVMLEDMVKQAFVFSSDMQFNSVDDSEDRWTTPYGRIQKGFAGATMPTIYWRYMTEHPQSWMDCLF